MNYTGSCHCGAVRLVLQSAVSATALGARECGCSFCAMQRASWTSDPDGQLEISTHGPLSRYRFGTKTADFLICGQCGAASAAVCEIGGRIFGVARVSCLDDSDIFLAQSQTANYDGEALDDRLNRRASLWTPALIKEIA